jgi:hypothetical protein
MGRPGWAYHAMCHTHWEIRSLNSPLYSSSSISSTACATDGALLQKFSGIHSRDLREIRI